MNQKKASQIATKFSPPHPLKTAVLFLVFNRPDITKLVFEAIRKAKPPRLYVAADGPRADKFGDEKKVAQVRRIATDVDWDCEVKTLFREKNLGCGVAVSSAIDWFFEDVEEGIILEDDCLPSQSFFWYCEELLEHYRDDARVMVVSGDNWQFGRRRTDYSYYFSRYSHIWGWASWRRAWWYYDKDMKNWPFIRDNGYLSDILQDKKAAKYWTQIFEKIYRGSIDTWDYQWTFTCWTQNGLTILPNVNLVSNIGFGENATHTPGYSRLSKITAFELSFPLKHQNLMIREFKADHYTQNTDHKQPNLFNWVIGKLYRLLSLIEGDRSSFFKWVERIRIKIYGNRLLEAKYPTTVKNKVDSD